MADDEQQQIKKLTDQIQADSAAAIQAKADDAAATLQAKNAAHTAGLKSGIAIGVVGALVLLGLIFGIKKLTQRFSVVKKPQVPA
ncbi:MAG: hypothetical protein LAO24_05620 [Acidobacteriia bacterium]|nr:hypothetical protein [Terriglobia bacterium]